MTCKFRVRFKCLSFFFLGCLLFLFPDFSGANDQNPLVKRLQNEIQAGHICYRLTEQAEIEKLLGKPESTGIEKDGGMDILSMNYDGILIRLAKQRDDKAVPFTLLVVSIAGNVEDIGQAHPLVLRNNDDLRKLDNFWGFQNVSLQKLDLRNEVKLIESFDFDSLTRWPAQDKLPVGFEPVKLLAEGKNPGLGIRELHKLGINGKGIGIAIIDQPLLLGHEEYTSRIIRYDATGVIHFPPQMHGSPVSSIAVGKQIGVAPEATLSYYAIPMMEVDNAPYVRVMRQIMAMNERLPSNERIRVISISTGMFSEYQGFSEWQKVLTEVEGKGIFVITCDMSLIDYGTLTLVIGKDPDNPLSYKPGYYAGKTNVLRVPTGNRVVASFRGVDVYTFERAGGMSWAAPYIGGLAVLAFQVNPSVTPAQIRELLVSTASKTEAGPIVNPKAFIDAVKKLNEPS